MIIITIIKGRTTKFGKAVGGRPELVNKHRGLSASVKANFVIMLRRLNGYTLIHIYTYINIRVGAWAGQDTTGESCQALALRKKKHMKLKKN